MVERDSQTCCGGSACNLVLGTLETRGALLQHALAGLKGLSGPAEGIKATRELQAPAAVVAGMRVVGGAWVVTSVAVVPANSTTRLLDLLWR